MNCDACGAMAEFACTVCRRPFCTANGCELGGQQHHPCEPVLAACQPGAFISGAEFLDQIHEALPDAFADIELPEPETKA